MIYLYVKTHNVTGLKYFGKTTKKDPFSYKGSGKYWRKHLRKHGNDVSTEIVGEFTNDVECTKFALTFSETYGIVESESWANLKEENGLDGSPKGVKFTENHKEKIRQSRLGKCYNDFDEETRQKMSLAARKRVEEQIQKGKNPFVGDRGKLLAKENNKRKLENGTHNFSGQIIVVDKQGKRLTISKELFWNQTGEKTNWEYVQHTSLEAKKRLMTAKEI